jgi:hypothetical protein
MTLDLLRAASRKAQAEAELAVLVLVTLSPNSVAAPVSGVVSPSPAPAVCPYCGRDISVAGPPDPHNTKCKLWMFTPEVRQKLYGYPTCLCHGLPDGKERDVIHNDEMTLRIARMSLSDFGPTR